MKGKIKPAAKASRNRYSTEFKQQTLARAQKYGVAVAAKDLGLQKSQITKSKSIGHKSFSILPVGTTHRMLACRWWKPWMAMAKRAITSAQTNSRYPLRRTSGSCGCRLPARRGPGRPCVAAGPGSSLRPCRCR
jgi:hypothetical protein